MKLSTISDEGAYEININKLKAYHHNNPPTNVIIMVVTINAKPSGKLEIGIERKTNLIFHLTCIPNQIIYLGLTQNLEKHLMRMILSGMKKKIQEVPYQEWLTMKYQEILNIKEGKRKQYHYIQEIM
jgi:hypothetical protein